MKTIFYRTLMSAFCCTVLSNITTSHAQQAGTLDTEFGNNGFFTLHLPFLYSALNGFVSDGQGAFFGIGATYNVTQPNIADNFLLKMGQDGNSALSFGNGGHVIDPLSPQFDRPHTIFKGDGGTCYVVGSMNRSSGGLYGYVAKFESDGARVPTFFDNGLLTVTNDSVNVFSFLKALELANGSHLMGGVFGYDAHLTMFDQNWVMLDNFGISGVAVFDFGGDTDVILDMITTSTGQFVFAGSTSGQTSANYCVLGKADSFGNLDPNFGDNGLVMFNPGTTTATQITSVIELPNGNIAVGGFFMVGTQSRAFIGMFNPNGTMLNSFGNNGILVVNPSPGAEMIYSIVIQPDNKIIFGGYGTFNGNMDLMLLRLNEDGTIDNSFGANGYSFFDVDGYDDQILDMEILADGKLLVCGGAGNGSVIGSMFARFHTGLNIGVAETGSPFELSVYPNPFTEALQLKATKPIDGITLTDALGRVVHHCSDAPCGGLISLSHLPTGVYRLTAQIRGQFLSRTVLRH